LQTDSSKPLPVLEYSPREPTRRRLMRAMVAALIVFVGGVAGAAVGSIVSPVRYTAVGYLQISSSPQVSTASISSAQRAAVTQIQNANPNVFVQPIAESRLISISATARDPRVAQRAANAAMTNALSSMSGLTVAGRPALPTTPANHLLPSVLGCAFGIISAIFVLLIRRRRVAPQSSDPSS
jgi:hypothetical protein